MAEDGSLFHGFAAAGIEGIAELTPHPTVAITDDYDDYPSHVAKAVAILRAADVERPLRHRPRPPLLHRRHRDHRATAATRCSSTSA